MPRIGLTQRVEHVETYGERRDCLDQQWVSVMRFFGLTPIPLSNTIEDVENYVSTLELDGVVFTGGNDFAHLSEGENVAPERDKFEKKLLQTAIDRSIPVLGVCRGLQLINLFCDGSLGRVNNHVAVEHSLKINSEVTPAPVESRQPKVNSYHNYGVFDQALGSDLTPVARASDGSIEWIEHEQYPITGVMWHPERDGALTALDRSVISHRLTNGDI